MENKNVASEKAVTYKQMMFEAGKHFGLRKKDLFKRVLLTTWPLALIFVFAFLLQSYHEINGQVSDLFMWFSILGMTAWAMFAALYGIVMRGIFEIEKVIWIDSYFDGRNLDLRQSWRIARRLFIQGTLFNLYLFSRYYAVPWIIYFVGVSGPFVVAATELYFGYTAPVWLVDLTTILCPVTLLGGLVAIWAYAYYVRAKLRFAWFLFLDTYKKPDYGFRSVLAKAEDLHKVSRSESFKKALIVNFGTDSVKIITSTVLDSFQGGIASVFGEKAGLLSGAVRLPAEEYARQASHFASLAAMYILYRQARELKGDATQEVNENIYTLSV